ncbi:cytochrome P450 [Variovorax sp. PBL-E5]|uniref:cytochrome P450 n=1 Tax=Variovorax sp. PBL-E5 TaxID=434014 RepID=UPI00131960AB|nr:cytochrome P450 [Variovorax sp. PBL-E5]VTU18723.1 Biotin biosynthesis cytochrome P450 [Variovorax sp. PBL-E5]
MKPPASPADVIAAVTHPNPYPWYAALRNGPPLVFDEHLRLWVASRAEVVCEVLACEALRVRPPAEAVPRAIAGTPAGEVFGHLVRMNDGAPHVAHRPPLQRALAGLDRQAVHAAALKIAAGLPAAPVSDLCFAMPVCAVAHLLGFADDMLLRVTDWMRDFVACLSALSSVPQLQAASEAAAALMMRFEQLVSAQPATGASLLAAVQAEVPGDGSRVTLANLVGLLSQTCEATAGLLGNSLIALTREPGLRRKIGSRAELLQPLVDEVARHDPSVHNTRRFVAEPTVLADTPLAPGDAVLVVLAAANRDPSLNPAPATFELLRAERRMLGFGHGPHACPGQALACTLAAAGVQALLADGLDIDMLMDRGWDYRPSANVRIPVFR